MTVFQYLRKRALYNVNSINSLFVSSFLYYNKIEVNNNSFIKKFQSKDKSEISKFIALIKKDYGVFDLEVLEKLFEFVISPEDKVVNGAVYTPKNIRAYMIVTSFKNANIDQSFKFADISCGCGGFLIDGAKYIKLHTQYKYAYIFEHFIYGIDIESYAVERSKIMLTLLALLDGEDDNFTFHIWVGNSLNFPFRETIQDFCGFNIIVGNPPYVCSRNIDEESKSYLSKWTVAKTGHPDLYIPFFQIGYENLMDNGTLCYITMNSFFKSLNGRGLREYFEKNKVNLSIKDFRSNQIFKSKSTYTCICLLRRSKSKSIKYSTNDGFNLNHDSYNNEIDYNRLDSVRGWNLYDTEFNLHVENIGTPLGKYCKSSHGLATLSNSIYIFDSEEEDDKYFYLKEESSTYRIEKNICRKAVNSNKVNDTNSFESLIHKIIYPYDENGNIIPEEDFQKLAPEAYRYLLLHKIRLMKRDRGKQNQYPTWYAFGRTQGLKLPSAKLFLPKFANRPLNCVLVNDRTMMFYNGQAFVSDSLRSLIIVKKVIESKLFWKYIMETSKPYHSGYFSLNGNYIKNFGIPIFSNEDENRLFAENDKDIIESIITPYYE